jgi:uncharacterized protein YehS (DUF1456 family)
MLNISDAKVAQIIGLSGLEISEDSISACLKKDDEEGFTPCTDEVLAHFLDGLVVERRGRDDSRPAPAIELPISNNMILKKLRVAFELKEEDLHAILQAADFPFTRPELNALFRKVGHSNYRVCGDQLLRNFLKGLTMRLRS